MSDEKLEGRLEIGAIPQTDTSTPRYPTYHGRPIMRLVSATALTALLAACSNPIAPPPPPPPPSGTEVTVQGTIINGETERKYTGTVILVGNNGTYSL